MFAAVYFIVIFSNIELISGSLIMQIHFNRCTPLDFVTIVFDCEGTNDSDSIRTNSLHKKIPERECDIQESMNRNNM